VAGEPGPGLARAGGLGAATGSGTVAAFETAADGGSRRFPGRGEGHQHLPDLTVSPGLTGPPGTVPV
jgi:hypothetical protein